MIINPKNIILSIVLVVTLLLNACANPNNLMFGSNKLHLKHAEIPSLESPQINLIFTDHEQNIIVGVIRESMPNANSHLQAWTKAMLNDQKQKRGNPIVEKTSGNITYYEVIDSKTKHKIIYLFDTNTKNDAVLMKFSKFPNCAEISSTYIQNLYRLKIS